MLVESGWKDLLSIPPALRFNLLTESCFGYLWIRMVTFSGVSFRHTSAFSAPSRMMYLVLSRHLSMHK